MKKKRVDIIVTGIILVILGILMFLFYYLNFNSYVVFDINKWIWKHFQSDISMFDIIQSRIVQYILFTLFYLVIFHLISLLCKSKVIKYIIVFVLGVVYSTQIFVTDTIINYIYIDTKYALFMKLGIDRFIKSDIWKESISSYGYGICIFNMCLMTSFLFLYYKIVRLNSRIDD